MKMRKRRKLVKEPRWYFITVYRPDLAEKYPGSVWAYIFAKGPIKVRVPKL